LRPDAFLLPRLLLPMAVMGQGFSIGSAANQLVGIAGVPRRPLVRRVWRTPHVILPAQDLRSAGKFPAGTEYISGSGSNNGTPLSGPS
jgi:hypothetical protein